MAPDVESQKKGPLKPRQESLLIPTDHSNPLSLVQYPVFMWSESSSMEVVDEKQLSRSRWSLLSSL